MWLMSCTLDTSHSEMSALKDVESIKIVLISVTRDTSHSPIAPCGPSEQSPRGDTFVQSWIPLLSSALDCGENMDWPAREFREEEISRAKKMTWEYEIKKASHVCRCLHHLSRCLHHLCVCIWAYAKLRTSLPGCSGCRSEWLTRVHIQYFEITQYSSPGISGGRPYEHGRDGVDSYYGVDVWDESSDWPISHLWMCDNNLRVLRLNATPCIWVSAISCLYSCESLLYHNMQYRVALGHSLAIHAAIVRDEYMYVYECC